LFFFLPCRFLFLQETVETKPWKTFGNRGNETVENFWKPWKTFGKLLRLFGNDVANFLGMMLQTFWE